MNYKQYKEILKDGALDVDGFVKCALALEKVKDGKLWRKKYKSFNEYCMSTIGQCESFVDQRIIDAHFILTHKYNQ